MRFFLSYNSVDRPSVVAVQKGKDSHVSKSNGVSKSATGNRIFNQFGDTIELGKRRGLFH